MHNVSCPTFIVHGQKDKLIPIEHAYQLKDKCNGPTFFLSPPLMTHNDFDFYEDLIRPLMRFLCQVNILQRYEDESDIEEPNDTLEMTGRSAQNIASSSNNVSKSRPSTNEAQK